MKYIFNGIATHFRPDNRNISACGIVNPRYATYDAMDCDCLRCRNSKKYKIYTGKIRIGKLERTGS